MSARRAFVLAFATATLGACGFELKRPPALRFKTIQLAGFPSRSPLAEELKRNIDASTTTPQFKLDPYTSLDVRAGVSTDHWRLQAFVTNATNERGELSANTAYHVATGQANVVLLRPRTVGLQLGFTL